MSRRFRFATAACTVLGLSIALAAFLLQGSDDNDPSAPSSSGWIEGGLEPDTPTMPTAAVVSSSTMVGSEELRRAVQAYADADVGPDLAGPATCPEDPLPRVSGASATCTVNILEKDPSGAFTLRDPVTYQATVENSGSLAIEREASSAE